MSVHGIMRSVCLLVALTAVSVAAFSHSKSTNMTKEAHSTTMPFLETTTELQLSNTTFGQLSRHAFDIINQEFTPSRPLPENERVHEQHGLGFPVCLAHDPSGARPLGTVDLEVLFTQEQTVVNPEFTQQASFEARLLGAAEDPKALFAHGHLVSNLGTTPDASSAARPPGTAEDPSPSSSNSLFAHEQLVHDLDSISDTASAARLHGTGDPKALFAQEHPVQDLGSIPDASSAARLPGTAEDPKGGYLHVTHNMIQHVSLYLMYLRTSSTS